MLYKLVKIKNKKILIFSAHPDDAEFFMGGTLAKLSTSNDIYLVVATNGEKGLKNRFKGEPFIRKAEQRSAAKLLGIKCIDFLGEKDGKLKYSRNLDSKVCITIEKYKPQIIFSFDPWNESEMHPDHRTLGFTVIDSLLSCNLEELIIDSIYLYNSLKPNLYSDISEFIDIKLKANKAHKSQFCEYNGGWNKKKGIINELAMLYGEKCNVKYAEVFRKISLCPSKRYIEITKKIIRNL